MNPLSYIMSLFGQHPAQQQSQQAQQGMNQMKWGGNAFDNSPSLIQSAQAQAPSPMPQQPVTGMPDEQHLRQAIGSVYGQDNPLLQNLSLYLQASHQMPQGADPMLPIILALRETQGGRDLTNPAKNAHLGQNNVYNLRNDTGAFQDYPDLSTAVMGNLQQGGQSGGVVGLLGGTKPSSAGIYQDWRQNPQDLSKLFAHWSPPTDSNGSLEEQVGNYNWIKNNLLAHAQ